MAATFGNLNLDELGVVGTPEIQYAAFETEVSQPKGYDGGVLANFRRAATTIKFNLTLSGTRAEIIDKLNSLTAAFQKGAQELVLPGMTPGYHFDAAPNMAIQPAQYIDGFVIEMKFVVPYGLAVKNVTKTRPPFQNDGPVAAGWSAALVAMGNGLQGMTADAVIVDVVVGDSHISAIRTGAFSEPFDTIMVRADASTDGNILVAVAPGQSVGVRHAGNITSAYISLLDVGPFDVSMSVYKGNAAGERLDEITVTPIRFSVSVKEGSVW